MLYLLLRIALSVVFLVFIFIAFERVLYRFIGIALFLILALWFWRYPVENVFFRFEDPVRSFNYSMLNKEIITLTEHEDNAVILYRPGSTDIYDVLLIKRDERGWKINVPHQVKTMDYHEYIRVLPMEGTELSFVLVTDILLHNHEPAISTVTDSNRSTFETLEMNFRYGQYIFHYTFTDTRSPDYHLVINRERVKLEPD